MDRFHKPVLLKQAIDYLRVTRGEKYIDATAGGGGHTEAILKLGGEILVIDCDPEAIKAARRRLTACPGSKFRTSTDPSWRLAQGNFGLLGQLAEKHGFNQVAGVFFDLGVSSHQLGTAARGFSFGLTGPLDMRMDPALTVTAADLVNGLNRGELNELFFKLGEEHHSRRISEAICRTRKIKPIRTTTELAEIIVQAVPKKRERVGWGGKHPATRCFQALRIAVNDELNNLKKALPQALNLLKPKGRLVVISFHSGEDRLVKRFFKKAEKEEKINILTAKPVRPSQTEIDRNPRSRSAKLRAIEKK